MSRITHILLWSLGALLALIALSVALLLTFDWNRARPWINARVSEATGRPFAIDGDLSLTWHAPRHTAGEAGWRGWIPWPRLQAQNITLGNPAWAKTPHMARIAQVTVAVSPLPLLDKRIVIPALYLDAPQLVLQRLEDGTNNWTFTREQQEAPRWQLQLQQLVLSNGSVHLNDALKRAHLRADLDTLEQAGKYQIGWKVTGTLNGEPVSGTGKAGAMLALQQDQARYPLQGTLRVGSTTVDATGTLTHPRDLAAVEMQLKISGISLAHLYPVLGIALPDTAPFSTEGRLLGTLNALGGHWRYENFSGKMGVSDVSGTVHFEARKPRPRLEGTVASNYLNFQDLAPLIGADSKESKARRGDKTVQPENKIFPVGNFRTERWRSVDTDIQFTGRRIVRKEQLPIDHLVTRIQMQNGVLSLAPLKFNIAGGSLVSNLKLNGTSKPVQAELKLSARHLKLKELFPDFQPMKASLGEINGDAALTSAGNSIAALMASANGEIKAVVSEGTISKMLLEGMGLNIGSVVLTQLFGDKQVKLFCAANDFAVTNGVMRARASVIDTEDATIYINGDINLAQEQLGLTIHPESKGVRLISLRTPLYVTGPFKKPKVGVDKGVLALKAGSAVALGALAPAAAALLPLINIGPGEKSECGHLLAQASAKPEAPPPGKSVLNATGR